MQTIVVLSRAELDPTFRRRCEVEVQREAPEAKFEFRVIDTVFDGPTDCNVFLDALAVRGTYDELSPMLHAFADLARASGIQGALRFDSPAPEGRGWCRVTSVAWEHYEIF